MGGFVVFFLGGQNRNFVKVWGRKLLLSLNNMSQREMFVGGVDSGCVWCDEANETEHIFL